MKTALRNARIEGGPGAPQVSVSIEYGRLAASGADLVVKGRESFPGSRLVTPGSV